MSTMMQLSERYLISNAKGTKDGALKADTHRLLCQTFISDYFDVDISYARDVQYKDEFLHVLVRSSTLPLTDYLDEVIDFPLDIAPNYRRLTLKFHDEFVRLATEFLEDDVFIMTGRELKSVLDHCHQYTPGKVIETLESYGFTFEDCCMEEKWFKMKSVLGDVVVSQPNKYFGTSYKATTFNGEVFDKKSSYATAI